MARCTVAMLSCVVNFGDMQVTAGGHGCRKANANTPLHTVRDGQKATYLL